MNHIFKECPICAKQSGTPLLCNSCFHNRTVIKDLKSKLNKQVPLQLEDFIKIFQKKKEEYLKKVSQDAWSSDRRNFTERQVENDVLSSFLRFLIGQTNQYARLQAEQADLQNRIDKKNQEIEEYVKTRWE